MKTKLVISLLGLLLFTTLPTGCIIHEHNQPRHRHHHSQYPAHVHGPDCGHALRGGDWIAIP